MLRRLAFSLLILFVFLIPSFSFAQDGWDLWLDGRSVGVVPVMSQGKDVFVSLGCMGRILGFGLKPKSDTLIISSGKNRIQVVENAAAVWYNVQLVPLAAPAMFDEQRWWMDSRSALKVMKLLLNSREKEHSLIWKGTAEITKEVPEDIGHDESPVSSPAAPNPDIYEIPETVSKGEGADLRAIRWGKYDDKIRLVLDLESHDPGSAVQKAGMIEIPLSPSSSFDFSDVASPYPSTVKVEVTRKNGGPALLIRYFSCDVTTFDLTDPERLVLDFSFTGRKQITAVPSVPAVHGTVPVKPALAARERLVVIDPGHGGKDPGAMANGIREKDINLEIAKRIAAHLKKMDIEVRLTRNDDRYLKLQERTDLANKWNAAMFVSIHANALPPGRHATGTEIYLMALPTDKDAMQLALIENKELVNGGGSSESSKATDEKTKMLLGILGNMQQNAKIGESTNVAEVLFNTGKKDGLPMKRVAQAPFYVLRGAGMPAVLIETGFLTDRREARLLASSGYQDELAASIARGISSYLGQTR